MLSIYAEDWFDGDCLHVGQPIRLDYHGDRIVAIEPDAAGRGAGLLTPGLVESHAHCFLDGAIKDGDARRAWGAQDPETLLAGGRRHLADALRRGITLIRDAGDRWGINHRLRAEAAAEGSLPRIYSVGQGIHKVGRYGSFLAAAVSGIEDIPAAVADRVAAGADAIKIVLTGIIDFARGEVRGAAQFNAEELQLLVACAHDAGLPTLAHCSGAAGIDLALAAGVDSIEHGFFMRPDQIEGLAANGGTWVPTFAPVAFQHDEPDWVGWQPAAVAGLRRILNGHAATLRRALAAGIHVLAGSDAGSHGVPHGAGLLTECRHLHNAGCDLTQILRAATSAPRRAWGLPGGRIAVDQPVDLALFDATATAGVDALDRVRAVWIGGEHASTATPSTPSTATPAARPPTRSPTSTCVRP